MVGDELIKIAFDTCLSTMTMMTEPLAVSSFCQRLDCRCEAGGSDPAEDCDDTNSGVARCSILLMMVLIKLRWFEVCVDDDSDGYRNTDTSLTVNSSDLDCDDSGEGSTSEPATDCDDTASSINPGATEIVADEIDQNCDTDETCYKDSDNDGFRTTDTSLTVNSNDLDCDDLGEGASSEPSTDCNDFDPAINPSITEVVDNGVDQDCDGFELCLVILTATVSAQQIPV